MNYEGKELDKSSIYINKEGTQYKIKRICDTYVFIENICNGYERKVSIKTLLNKYNKLV